LHLVTRKVIQTCIEKEWTRGKTLSSRVQDELGRAQLERGRAARAAEASEMRAAELADAAAALAREVEAKEGEARALRARVEDARRELGAAERELRRLAGVDAEARELAEAKVALETQVRRYFQQLNGLVVSVAGPAAPCLQARSREVVHSSGCFGCRCCTCMLRASKRTTVQ
jgi:predicted  nucleic acid-binding Zn-ribbon protein